MNIDSFLFFFYRRYFVRLKSRYMGLFCCRSSRSPVEDKDIIPLTVGVEKELTFDTSDTGPGRERLILSTPSMPWTYTGPCSTRCGQPYVYNSTPPFRSVFITVYPPPFGSVFITVYPHQVSVYTSIPLSG